MKLLCTFFLIIFTVKVITFRGVSSVSLSSSLAAIANSDDADYEDYEENPKKVVGYGWRGSSGCPTLTLANGRVRLRSRGRIAKFLCRIGFQALGKRFATCIRGHWNAQPPICISRGCPAFIPPANGRMSLEYRGALLNFACNPGFTLVGSRSLYCDGKLWNSTTPNCEVAVKNPQLSCDFEREELCGWSQDSTHDFDWKRFNFVTPSGHVGTGPSHDHTLGEGRDGFYMYIEASSPRVENDTARLFSPVYGSELSQNACFRFWYHMYGATTGQVRVYIKPASDEFSSLRPKFTVSGDQGNKWIQSFIHISPLDESFQVIVEGVRGPSYVSDSAIDDVELLSGFECGDLVSTSNMPSTIYSTATSIGKSDELPNISSTQSPESTTSTANQSYIFPTTNLEQVSTTVTSNPQSPSTIQSNQQSQTTIQSNQQSSTTMRSTQETHHTTIFPAFVKITTTNQIASSTNVSNFTDWTSSVISEMSDSYKTTTSSKIPYSVTRMSPTPSSSMSLGTSTSPVPSVTSGTSKPPRTSLPVTTTILTTTPKVITTKKSTTPRPKVTATTYRPTIITTEHMRLPLITSRTMISTDINQSNPTTPKVNIHLWTTVPATVKLQTTQKPKTKSTTSEPYLETSSSTSTSGLSIMDITTEQSNIIELFPKETDMLEVPKVDKNHPPPPWTYMKRSPSKKSSIFVGEVDQGNGNFGVENVAAARTRTAIDQMSIPTVVTLGSVGLLSMIIVAIVARKFYARNRFNQHFLNDDSDVRYLKDGEVRVEFSDLHMRYVNGKDIEADTL